MYLSICSISHLLHFVNQLSNDVPYSLIAARACGRCRIKGDEKVACREIISAYATLSTLALLPQRVASLGLAKERP